MPILNSAYLSNLQKVYFDGFVPLYNENRNLWVSVEFQKFILLETFTQTQTNEVKPNYMIQGSLGTRIVDVAGITWKTTLKSPVLFFELDLNSPGILRRDTFNDALDVLQAGWNNIIAGGTVCSFLLEKGQVQINKDSVSVDVTLKHDNNNHFSTLNNNNAVPGGFQLAFTEDEIKLKNPKYPIPNIPVGLDFANFIARTAKWYDCRLIINNLYLPNTNVDGLVFNIESADINYNVNISEKYFVGAQTQLPNYAISSYGLEASFVLVGKTYDFNLNPTVPIQQQVNQLSQLIATGFNRGNNPAGALIMIGFGDTARYINLGNKTMKTSLKLESSAGDVVKIRLDFTAFTA